MSEITTVMTVEITFVQKVKEDAVAEIVSLNQSETAKRGFGEYWKGELGVDDVKVANVQSFVREE